MKRAILRLPAEVQEEIVGLSREGDKVSPLLVKVLKMALTEPIEWLDDELDMEDPAPRRVAIRGAVYIESK